MLKALKTFANKFAKKFAPFRDCSLGDIGRYQGFVELALDRRIITANGVFLNMLGYSQSEITNMDYGLLVSPEFRGSTNYHKFWQQLNSGECVSDDFLYHNRDGKEVWGRATFNPIRDESGKLSKVMGLITDVTAVKKDSANAILNAVTEIASDNSDLSGRTKKHAANLEEAAASIEQSTSTACQNAKNVQQTSQLAIGASDVAEKGGSVVSQAVIAMSSINGSSKKIVDIVSVIDGIAFQTNILALNAAVEAARTDEQGRGFAVVASEIRNLAQRSSTAAKEIKAPANGSVEKAYPLLIKLRQSYLLFFNKIKELEYIKTRIFRTNGIENGAKLADEAGTTMDEFVQSIKHVADIIDEITTVSHEQSSGIEQVNDAISQVDEGAQQDAALVEKKTATAEEMQTRAQWHLIQVIDAFSLHASQAKPAKAHRPERRDFASRPFTERKAPGQDVEAAKAAGSEVKKTAAIRSKIANAKNNWDEF
ncbi:methyl-accepting chemotaxis protein [Nitrosomonas sp. Nm51]|uniref:methyl-accepting chemotaxis protein n=1 Tax=Nitrosomonas sp. Nm51 TaxID=133720 RepID=UPI0008BB2451|nr:methyl-accepting chemotaxis protein [Nitrosomonas sp. Nm51]SEQ94615.1 methyl-accepting chemotaxis protein [Nitrosomonas sp. Nm51]